MNPSQKKQCHVIIHSHAVAAAAGNAVPVPGLGIAADLVAMTSMAMSLCAVFGGNIKEEAAKTLAIAAIKNTMLKQPIRTLAKELSKLVPGLGQIVAPSITVVMLEAAGWVLAEELEQTHSERKAKRRTSDESASSSRKITPTAAAKRVSAKKAVARNGAARKVPALSSETAKKAVKKPAKKAVKKAAKKSKAS
ncbi:hypothetical protein [Blastomonas sp.]|uniref:hypothetical protein n=1 Tax=Blastomonas sp. TaxID=1909299 RepID=UPI0035943DD8